MNIRGLQSLTCIDYPGKIACTIFLAGCNFRCGFCHNPELVLGGESKKYTEKDILSFLEKRIGLLDGVCITGGEPLLSLKKSFVKKIKALGYKVKLDTNGSYPEKLEEYIDEGLIDSIAMDIKAPPQRYSEVVCATTNVKKLEESIKLISDFHSYEFRTTVIPGIHTEKDIREMKQWLIEITKTDSLQAYYLQGFQSKGKLIDLSFANTPSPTKHTLESYKEVMQDLFNICEIRS